MSFRTPDGSTITVDTEILDEFDAPVVPKPGYPKVALLDVNRDVIAQYSATPKATVGQWESVIVLPLLGVTQTTEYRVRWRCMGQDGERYSVSDTLIVDPKADRRDSEVVVMDSDTIAEFVMPIRYDAAMAASYQIYHDNVALLPSSVLFSDPAVEVDAGIDRSVVTIPTVVMIPGLFANLLSVRATINRRPRTFNYKYWCITPQIAVGMTMVEDFLNKSRIENVIPELEYTSGDLVGYLERGLYMFNMTGQITSFTGTNMQGPILDCWIICSTYWALGAQLMAEGSLAFDFSGQGVSLNVDRTPQLEAALGRIEARIQDTVVPFKKALVAQGIITGDGSVGGSTMRNPYTLGTLSMINAPTTRVNGWTSNYIGRRF